MKVEDSIQDRITGYAHALTYDDLTPAAIHAAKVRIIDTLGALIAGFFAEPCRIARDLAAQMPQAKGATVIGTRMKTTPDMAALVNGTTAHYLELIDCYHWPGSYGGHPCDTLMPALAAGEYAQANGREFIASVVLAYEIWLRISDVYHNKGFDHTTITGLATAVAAGKLLKLSRDQLAHCISMAIVPNNALRITRTGHLSMWKSTASGQAGRAGVFAALLAQAGMEGPHLPFEGKAGWCDHVALERFSLDTMGGNGTPFKIMDTSIKMRPCGGNSISTVLAAEQIGPLTNSGGVKDVIVEVYKATKVSGGTSGHHWNPESKESADHSTPYVVAATLLDGKLTLHSFDDAHLWNPELRALMQKIKVVENEEFTRAHHQVPAQHHARVTVVTSNGDRLVGESGSSADTLSAPKSDRQIEDKFRSLTEDFLGAKRVNTILDQLWHVDDMSTIAEMLPPFVLA